MHNLKIIIDGVQLNQFQLNAVAPIINAAYVSKSSFKQHCIDAMDKAGCPLYNAEGLIDANAQSKP